MLIFFADAIFLLLLFFNYFQNGSFLNHSFLKHVLRVSEFHEKGRLGEKISF